ncbi:hypothetical protein [Undibacterium sp. TS12]|uniref:hypothetical protein n=1 Tax=Undibacterium sp. TS12 TaxID=2908202 RepID=UPI001F4C61A0|nr:hypothetical protein [Undibacterium sp. TS12]MCH8618125.1 hypothetical protein [Undibacterium sp. TS12]
MSSPIEIDVWWRQGHSILWDAAKLAALCGPKNPISLRQLLRFKAAGWVGVDDVLIRDRALVVAGLDGALDALHPDKATDWLEQSIYPVILSFQKSVASGGREAALIFWFADSRRFTYRQAEQAAYWHCRSAQGSKEIPLGRCLWNGSEPNSQEIRMKDNMPPRLSGYYLQRIS